ncbi:MAG TPA: hypothetical protein VGE52_01295, partial [Pirellulales bacterium]
DLEVKFVRRDGDDTISVGVPVGDRHVNIALSAERGRAHAIYTVDGKGADNNPASVKPGALVNGREYTLDVKVVPNGDRAQIEVQLDGRRLIRWEGRTASLSQSPGTREDPLCIWLEAADARVTYREARLRVRSGAVRLGTL